MNGESKCLQPSNRRGCGYQFFENGKLAECRIGRCAHSEVEFQVPFKSRQEMSSSSLEEDISKKVEGNHHIVWQSILPWGGNVRAWMQGGGRLCRE